MLLLLLVLGLELVLLSLQDLLLQRLLLAAILLLQGSEVGSPDILEA